MGASSVVWLGAIVTLAVLSFVFKSDNPAYRLAQNAFLGVAAGHMVVVGWNTLKTQAIQPLQSGKAAVLIPVVIGLLLYARFVPGREWLARVPLAALIGVGAGLGLAGAVQAQLLAQLNATASSLLSIDSLVLFVGVVSVVSYFFMTGSYSGFMQKGLGAGLTRLGRWAMMIGFGATFGNTVMGRCTLLIQRLEFLLRDWIGVLR